MTAAAAPGPATAQLIVAQNGEELRAVVAKHVAASAARAIAERGRFVVALSGGSMPQTLAGLADVSGLEWDKVWVVFSDERCVALDHDDSNFKACKTHLFDKVPLPLDHVLCVDASLPPDQAAAAYQAQLLHLLLLDTTTTSTTGQQQQQSGGGGHVVLDLVLLGMGPDGHTASLFPYHPLLQQQHDPGSSSWVVAAITDSPKPPPCRITLTMPAINAAREVAFIAAGGSKAALFQEAFTLLPPSSPPTTTGGGGGSSSHHVVVSVRAGLPYPAFQVRPTSGALFWFTDHDAAAKLLQQPATTTTSAAAGGAAAL